MKHEPKPKELILGPIKHKTIILHVLAFLNRSNGVTYWVVFIKQRSHVRDDEHVEEAMEQSHK